MCGTKSADEIRRKFRISFGLLTEQIELVLLVTERRKTYIFHPTSRIDDFTNNKAVLVLTSFFSKLILSEIKPTLVSSDRSKRSRHDVGSRMFAFCIEVMLMKC